MGLRFITLKACVPSLVHVVSCIVSMRFTIIVTAITVLFAVITDHRLEWVCYSVISSRRVVKSHIWVFTWTHRVIQCVFWVRKHNKSWVNEKHHLPQALPYFWQIEQKLILSSDWTKTQRLGKSKTCVGSATTKCQQFSKLLLMKCRKLN